MFPAKSFAIVILLIAALGVLVAFQLWLVAAAMLLLLAGLALHETTDEEKFQKLESRISLVQVGGEEFGEKICKTVSEMSDAINFLRGEFQQLSRSIENRFATFEQPRETLDTQKFYDLVQKVIELENRISSLAHREEPKF
jgi:hypothetical protein